MTGTAGLRSARARTLALTAALAAVAVVLSLRSATELTGRALFERPVLLVVLAAVFFLAEQYLVTVEFRRESHSMTFAGVPLALGVIFLPAHGLALARVAGSLVAFALQRPSPDKAAYNVSAYAFEAAVSATVVHALLGRDVPLHLAGAAVVVAVVALVDQLMSAFVLAVIWWHTGQSPLGEAKGVLLGAAGLSVVTSVVGLAAALLLNHGLIGDLLVALLVGFATLMYRVYAATTRRHQALATVHDFVVDSVGASSAEELGREALTRIRAMLRAATAEVVLAPAGPAGRYTRIVIDEQGTARTTAEDGPGADWVLTKAVDAGEPTLLPSSTKDPALRRWLDTAGLTEAIVVPLRAGDDRLGAVVVKDRLGETLTFTGDDLTLLQTLAGHLALSLRGTQVLERLAHEATHDSLTGLVNRTHLADRIGALDERADGDGAALLLVDLNRFKEVNDVLGHETGDRLLVVVAERLAEAVPPPCVIARLGGDEFAVLAPGLGTDPQAAAERLATDLRVRLAAPVRFGEVLLVPETSIGVAVADRVPAERLLRCADTAMHAAKNTDRGIAVYDVEMDRGRAERLALLADLRVALDEHPEQFVVFYQPKFDLADRRIISAEALIRWHHPDLGTVPPDRFIPLAETSGLIDRLTTHVLLQAVRECGRWNQDGAPLTVSVNLSPRTVTDPSLPARVAGLLADAGLPADRLVLEITEGSVIEEPERAVPILYELVERGVRLSLDDFGTGYSSLSYLQQLPVSELKIDRSFVARLDDEDAGHARALVASIVALARSLGLDLVAEGIETEAQLAELAALGCRVGQGYLVSRPVPAVAMRELVGSPATAAVLPPAPVTLSA